MISDNMDSIKGGLIKMLYLISDVSRYEIRSVNLPKPPKGVSVSGNRHPYISLLELNGAPKSSTL